MSDASKPFAVSGAPPLPAAPPLPSSAPPIPVGADAGGVGTTAPNDGRAMPRLVVKPIDDSSKQAVTKFRFPQTIAVVMGLFVLILLVALAFPMSLSYSRAILVLGGIWLAIMAFAVNQSLPGGHKIWKPVSSTGSVARLMFFVGLSVLLPQLHLNHHLENATSFNGYEAARDQAFGGLRFWITGYMVVVLPLLAFGLLKTSDIAGVRLGDLFKKHPQTP